MNTMNQEWDSCSLSFCQYISVQNLCLCNEFAFVLTIDNFCNVPCLEYFLCDWCWKQHSESLKMSGIVSRYIFILV